MHGDGAQEGVDGDASGDSALPLGDVRVKLSLGAVHHLGRVHRRLDGAGEEERAIDGVVLHLGAETTGDLGDAVHHEESRPATGVLAIVQDPLVDGVQAGALQPRRELVLELVEVLRGFILGGFRTYGGRGGRVLAGVGRAIDRGRAVRAVAEG